MIQKKIAVVGATGSIGTSAFDIFRRYPDKFKPVMLAAGSSVDTLASAVWEFCPSHVAIADKDKFNDLKHALCGVKTKIYAGIDGIEQAINECGAGTCLSAAVGSGGLLPTIAAINAGMDIALANKESLVAAGDIIMPLAKKKGVNILPVDSEHSALLQCMASGKPEEISKLIITASGGAFRDFTQQQLTQATPQQALSHPTWNMGKKITVDSATLANKALEVIEAHHLFGVPYEKIEVLIHRQSLIHGMIEYCDGAVMAQLAQPDMRLPILHALSYPQRLESGVQGPSFAKLKELTFQLPDHERFGMLQTGIDAGKKGGLYPAVYSAANETAVSLFINGKISFNEITEFVQLALEQCSDNEVTIHNILEAEKIAKNTAFEFTR